MHLIKAKEINKKIIEECNEKIEKSLDKKAFDSECFEVISQAIDNLCDIEKLEKYEDKNKEAMVSKEMVLKKKNAKTETTEFEQLIYDICAKFYKEDVSFSYVTIIADTIEDLRLLHPKMYENLMRKLKEMLH